VMIFKSEKHAELERSRRLGPPTRELRARNIAMPMRRRRLLGASIAKQRSDHSSATSLTVLTQGSQFGPSTRHNIQAFKGLRHAIRSGLLPANDDRLSVLNPEPRTLLGHLIRPIPEQEINNVPFVGLQPVEIGG